MLFGRSDHFSDASQVNAEAQLALNAAFGRKALESARRFFDLHVGVFKVCMQMGNEMTQDLFAARNPQDVAALALAQMQPVSRKSFAYACHLAGIAVGAQGNFIELVGGQVTQSSRDTTLLAAEMSMNGPPGLNRLAGILRSLFEQASAGCEQITQATRSVMGALESNLISAANRFARSAEPA